MQRRLRRGPMIIRIAGVALGIGAFLVLIGHASHGGPHTGTFRVWSLNETMGFDPHETVDDIGGLTGQVGSPTNVTAMENLFGVPPCGLLFWNRDTNDFIGVGATGG